MLYSNRMAFQGSNGRQLLILQSMQLGFNARNVLGAVSVSGANGWRLQVSGEIGLTDGAPDHGLTVGASRRF